MFSCLLQFRDIFADKKGDLPYDDFQSLLICRICGFYSLAACFHLSAKGANERWPKLSYIKWADLNFSHIKINCMTFVLA